MHRATVLLRVSTVVAFCAALIGGGAVGAKAEITASVPAGVHWRASPEGMPLWGPNRFWPGSGLVLRRLGPGFTENIAAAAGLRQRGATGESFALLRCFVCFVVYCVCFGDRRARPIGRALSLSPASFHARPRGRITRVPLRPRVHPVQPAGGGFR